VSTQAQAANLGEVTSSSMVVTYKYFVHTAWTSVSSLHLHRRKVSIRGLIMATTLFPDPILPKF
jgi:hypothetical protein